MEPKVRLIKKYPNRRLYDTGESCYIKLVEVKLMIEKGIPIKVIDSQTKEDITRSILLQIIYEQEANQEPLFSTENLEDFIRYYGENSRESFIYFMEQNLRFFHAQQDQMQTHLNEFMDNKNNTLDFWANSTRKNLDMWEQMQDNLLKSSAFIVDSKTTKKK